MTSIAHNRLSYENHPTLGVDDIFHYVVSNRDERSIYAGNSGACEQSARCLNTANIEGFTQQANRRFCEGLSDLQ